MKRNRLEIEYSYDFELLGLTTSAKSDKRAWELNRQLQIHLVRKADLLIQVRSLQLSYSVHAHESPVNTLRLFRNKSNEIEQSKHLLVPEYPHGDFILMIQGEELQSNRLREVLRNIPSIELVAFIPLDTLKSKETFIF
jgi:hypothetical protein